MCDGVAFAVIAPWGIPRTLGPERMRDLITSLLVDPPQMPVYGDAPPKFLPSNDYSSA